MTREEIITYIQEQKAKGFSYKGLALQAGLKPQDIYDYIKRKQVTSGRIHSALETYIKGGENT